MTSDNKISINLLRDFAEILRSRLTTAGYSVSASDSPDEVCFKYFNAVRRRIDPHPRIVLIAKDLIFEPHREAIEMIKHKAEKGEDLTPHQSRRIARPNFNDRLFNAWDMHHFHLGTKVDDDGFMAQDNPLLFARVTATHMYMIGIFDHSSFAMQRLVQILLENWPETISDFRYKNVIDVEGRLSDEDIRLTRDAGVDTAVRMPDGTIYGPMGGGITMSGRNVHAVIDANICCATLEQWQKWIEMNIQLIIDDGRQKGFDLKPPFSFRLVLQNGRAYAVEQNISFSVYLNEFPVPEIPGSLP
jgi:hypothetical protein